MAYQLRHPFRCGLNHRELENSKTTKKKTEGKLKHKYCGILKINKIFLVYLNLIFHISEILSKNKINYFFTHQSEIVP